MINTILTAFIDVFFLLLILTLHGLFLDNPNLKLHRGHGHRGQEAVVIMATFSYKVQCKLISSLLCYFLIIK